MFSLFFYAVVYALFICRNLSNRHMTANFYRTNNDPFGARALFTFRWALFPYDCVTNIQRREVTSGLRGGVWTFRIYINCASLSTVLFYSNGIPNLPHSTLSNGALNMYAGNQCFLGRAGKGHHFSLSVYVLAHDNVFNVLEISKKINKRAENK